MLNLKAYVKLHNAEAGTPASEGERNETASKITW